MARVCAVTTRPSVDAQSAVQWTFTGSLASNAQLAVTDRIRVNQ